MLATKGHFCSALLKGPSFFLLPQTQNMVEIRANSQRPTCPTCTKPSWLCLCARLKTRDLANSVSVSILQHSLEKKHPLNSTRIARLGLKNLIVETVSDVNFEAQFDIRLIERKSGMGLSRGLDGKEFDQDEGNVGDLAQQVFAKCLKEKSFGLNGTNGRSSLGSEISDSKNNQHQFGSSDFVGKSRLSMSNRTVLEAGDDEPAARVGTRAKILNLDSDVIEDVQTGNEGPVITATIGKQGVVTYLWHMWMLQNRPEKPDFNSILATQLAHDALAKGFVVQKLQKRQREGSVDLEEYMEFEVEVPPGSVLLFPSEEAVGVDGLKAIDLDVKNLIVLDGTWAKAKRMYAENPWMKLLPHLKLEPDKVSLYSGVRTQPKTGCLSTIESIVYALKEVGDDNLEGLDDLLNVFESMVGDQKRCKERRLRNTA